jgi:hypothetical protein
MERPCGSGAHAVPRCSQSLVCPLNGACQGPACLCGRQTQCLLHPLGLTNSNGGRDTHVRHARPWRRQRVLSHLPCRSMNGLGQLQLLALQMGVLLLLRASALPGPVPQKVHGRSDDRSGHQCGQCHVPQRGLCRYCSLGACSVGGYPSSFFGNDCVSRDFLQEPSVLMYNPLGSQDICKGCRYAGEICRGRRTLIWVMPQTPSTPSPPEIVGRQVVYGIAFDDLRLHENLEGVLHARL